LRSPDLRFEIRASFAKNAGYESEKRATPAGSIGIWVEVVRAFVSQFQALAAII
jgi:hypothetical protein